MKSVRPATSRTRKICIVTIASSEKNSARVRTFVAPEKSEEGKEQLLVAVGTKAAIAKLGSLQTNHRQVGRPARISDAGGGLLIGEGKALSGRPIDSLDRDGIAEMLMELVIVCS